MEFFEIEKRLGKESQTYTPDVYGNIVAEAQAEGLLNARAINTVGGRAAVKAGANLGFKKLISIIVSSIVAVAIAVTSITVSVLNSNGGGGGNPTAGIGTEEGPGSNGDDETGGNGDDETGGNGDDETGGNGDDETGGNGDDETGGNGDDETGGNGDDETKITTYVGLTYKFQLVFHKELPPNASEGEINEMNMLVGLYFNWFFGATITFSAEDSFTLVEERGTTYTGAVEKTEFDYQIDLNVKGIPLPSEDGYLYVTFNKNYATNEIQYESIDIKVIPEGKSYYDVITLHFVLEK